MLPQRPHQAQHAQHLEAGVEHREGGQDAQQVDDGHKGEGIADEGPDRPAAEFKVRRGPAQQIVRDEDDHRGPVDPPEEGRGLLEDQRQQAQEDDDHHKAVVQRADAVASPVHLNDLKYAFSHGVLL